MAGSVFGGEGYRKLWARLRQDQGILAPRKQVLRVMGEHALLAPVRRVHYHADRRHDGTIIPEAPHRLWGTDATRVEAEQDGWGRGVMCSDHCHLEAWAEVVKAGDRLSARLGWNHRLPLWANERVTGLQSGASGSSRNRTSRMAVV